MPKTIKYITIGTAACCDVGRALPEHEKTSDRIMNVISIDKEGNEKLFDEDINPVSLSKELCLDKCISKDESIVPEISLREVEKFIKGSDFVLIILTAFDRTEYMEALEIIKIVQKTKVPFHVLLCRLPEFFCEYNHEIKLLEEQIESLTKNVTKSPNRIFTVIFMENLYLLARPFHSFGKRYIL